MNIRYACPRNRKNRPFGRIAERTVFLLSTCALITEGVKSAVKGWRMILPHPRLLRLQLPLSLGNKISRI